MKKQYILCCALLLSTPYLSIAMQPRYPAAHNAQVNQVNENECPICLDHMAYGDRNEPRVRLSCNHTFHVTCITQWDKTGALCPVCRAPIQMMIPDFPDPVQQPVQQAQRAHVQAEQRVHFTPQEQQLIQQVGNDLGLLLQQAQQPVQPVVPVQRTYFTPQEQQLIQQVGLLLQQVQRPMQQAEQAQPVAPVQAIQPARPAQPVQAEQRVQLTPRQQEILQTLIRDVAGLGRDDIAVMLINAYDNPLALANSDFMAVLNNQQRVLAQEFVAITLDAEAVQQPARPAQPALDFQEHALLAQLALELAPLERDNIDDVIIQAYTNPYVLAQSPAFIAVLNDQQKDQVDALLARYMQRISGQNQ